MHTDRTLRRALPILLAFLIIVLLSAGLGAAQEKPKSLYQRLGGYDVIAAIVDDFGPRIAKDPHVGRFAVGLAAASRKRNRQLIVDQLCELTGGPCFYIGRPMKTAHEGLGITEADWEIAMKHLAATLDKLKVPQPEREEFTAVVNKLKDDIVDKSAPKKSN